MAHGGRSAGPRAAGSADADVPPWQADLQRYQALRESLAARPSPRRHPRLRPDGCLLEGRPVLNRLHVLATFEWPVHRIGPRYRGRERDGLPVRLVLFRNAIGGIDHIVLGEHAEVLIADLARRRVAGRRLITDLARRLADQQCADAIGLQRGLALLLEQFRARGLVLGSLWDNRAP